MKLLDQLIIEKREDIYNIIVKIGKNKYDCKSQSGVNCLETKSNGAKCIEYIPTHETINKKKVAYIIFFKTID